MADRQEAEGGRRAPAGEGATRQGGAGEQGGLPPTTPGSPGAAPPDAAPPGDGAGSNEQEVGRVGQSERQGQGGYGNDTGFAGGTTAPRDDA